jgi:ABC-2 type transport system permease protein
MTNLTTVYRRECSSYFNSPIAYIVIVAFLALMSLFFFSLLTFFKQQNPDFRPYFENLVSFSVFSSVILPAITMRLWSEEKKQGTIELLMTYPLRTWEVVLAKYLAGYTLVIVAILLTFTVPLTVSWVLPLDWGAVFTNYLGILLIASVYISLGSFISSLTQNQIVALMVTFVGAAGLLLIGVPGNMTWIDENFPGQLGTFLGKSFGTYFHYQNFARGLINPVDLVYVGGMTGLFLLLNILSVDGRKY